MSFIVRAECRNGERIIGGKTGGQITEKITKQTFESFDILTRERGNVWMIGRI